MRDKPVPPRDSQALERIAGALRRSGFAVPALLLIGIARPLGVVVAELLSLLQPIAPGTHVQDRIGQMAGALEDDEVWTRLEKLLQ